MVVNTKYVQAKIYEVRFFIDGIVSKTSDSFPVILIKVENHQWNNNYCHQAKTSTNGYVSIIYND